MTMRRYYPAESMNSAMEIFEVKSENKKLRKAVESFRAAVWDSLYGKGITKEYAQAVDKEIREALGKC